MRSAKSVGQFIGFMLLSQLFVAPVAYFGLMRPGTNPGYLAIAARVLRPG